jgi:hypothetical protein
MKPTLKAPGTKRLKLRYDDPLSNLAFKFNIRRYIAVGRERRQRQSRHQSESSGGGGSWRRQRE